MISVLVTVLNEGESIRRLFDSLCAQTRQPDEIIVVDGGSRDQTVEIMNSYADRLPLKIIVQPGANISAGRNRAAREAQGDLFAITDAGVRLEPDWLERLVAPLLSDPEIGVAAGFFHAHPFNAFEAAMGATVLPLASEIDAATFLPSSRSVALRAQWFHAVGGYPEWLDYCEDLIFDLRLKMLTSFAFVPDAVANFQPRGSLRAFYKQYYLYARGDGKADLWRKRHAVRYITYLGIVPGVAWMGAALHPLFWLLYLPGAAVYLAQPYRRLPQVLRRAGMSSPSTILKTALLIPIIRVVGDVAKMLGYPVGLRWRAQNNPPNWQIVEKPINAKS